MCNTMKTDSELTCVEVSVVHEEPEDLRILVYCSPKWYAGAI